MFAIVPSKRYVKSLRRLHRSGKLGAKARDDLADVLDYFVQGKRLPAPYADHALEGEFSGYRDCHIRGDLLIVYRRFEREEIIELTDIGTHAQIFG